MGWFSIFKRKDPRINHDLTPEDGEAGAAATATKGEINKLKLELMKEKIKLEHQRDMLRLRADIEEAQQDLEELADNGESDPGAVNPDAALIGLISNFMASKNAGSAPISQPMTTNEATPDGEPTNEQLRDLWHKLPEGYKAQAQEMIKK